MGQTVNLLAYAFGGSNPSSPTIFTFFLTNHNLKIEAVPITIQPFAFFSEVDYYSKYFFIFVAILTERKLINSVAYARCGSLKANNHLPLSILVFLKITQF